MLLLVSCSYDLTIDNHTLVSFPSGKESEVARSGISQNVDLKILIAASVEPEAQTQSSKKFLMLYSAHTCYFDALYLNIVCETMLKSVTSRSE